MYHKLFQENESKLQQYDRLLDSRDKDLRAYMALKKGHFSQYLQIKMAASSNQTAIEALVSQLRLGSQHANNVGVLVPQLLKKRNSSEMCDDNLVDCNRRDFIYQRDLKIRKNGSESDQGHFELRGRHREE